MTDVVKLRGGAETLDPRLDRVPRFDPRSRDYPIRALELPEGLRARSWDLPRAYYLDQGREGACVGAGVTHELKATPVGTRLLDMTFAREQVYWAAQRTDPWEGGSYPGARPFYEGTSVLDGLRAASALGWFDSYWWAFSIEEALSALVHEGPLVIGVDWTEGMARPRPSGLIRADGRVLGGHCVAVLRFIPKPRIRGETGLPPCVGIAQSWGPAHGDRGMVYLPVEDLAALLGDRGECAVIRGRRRP